MPDEIERSGGYRDNARPRAPAVPEPQWSWEVTTSAGLGDLTVALLVRGLQATMCVGLLWPVALACATGSHHRSLWLALALMGPGAATLAATFAAVLLSHRMTNDHLVTVCGRIDRSSGEARFVADDGVEYALFPRSERRLWHAAGAAEARVHARSRAAFGWRHASDDPQVEERQAQLDAYFCVGADDRRALMATWSPDVVIGDGVVLPWAGDLWLQARLFELTTDRLVPHHVESYVLPSSLARWLRMGSWVRLARQPNGRIIALELLAEPSRTASHVAVLDELRGELH
jgi:hypothetical protein